MGKPKIFSTKLTSEPLKVLYALYDEDGYWANTFDDRGEAEADAWGPRFRTYEIREYRLVPKRERKRKEKADE
jgi:hypothetical protein